MRRLLAVLTTLALLLIALSLAAPRGSAAPSQGGGAVVIELRMDIDGGALELVKRGVSEARRLNATIVLSIDSYGGYLGAADSIVRELLGYGKGCVAWIPRGGKAVSAASMVALACRSIYMGAGSSIGAAQPVPATEKSVSYVASRFRALAQLHFRGNGTLVRIAEEFVTRNRVLTAEEAWALGFAKRGDTLGDVLAAEGLVEVSRVSPSPWEKLLSLISSPIVAPAMLGVGVMLIVAEILITGFQGYGVAGAVLIALALYGMTLVPPDLLATILIVAGLVLIAVEMHTPGFGAFGFSGLALTAIGLGLSLYQEPYPTITPPHAVLLGLLGFFAGLMLLVFYKAAKIMRRRYPARPEEKVLGQVGRVKTRVCPGEPGVVYVAGEDWTAFSATNSCVEPGTQVRVVKAEGLKLCVEPLEESSS